MLSASCKGLRAQIVSYISIGGGRVLVANTIKMTLNTTLSKGRTTKIYSSTTSMEASTISSRWTSMGRGRSLLLFQPPERFHEKNHGVDTIQFIVERAVRVIWLKRVTSFVGSSAMIAGLTPRCGTLMKSMSSENFSITLAITHIPTINSTTDQWLRPRTVLTKRKDMQI